MGGKTFRQLRLGEGSGRSFWNWVPIVHKIEMFP
jgi:hypothetical protein